MRLPAHSAERIHPFHIYTVVSACPAPSCPHPPPPMHIATAHTEVKARHAQAKAVSCSSTRRHTLWKTLFFRPYKSSRRPFESRTLARSLLATGPAMTIAALAAPAGERGSSPVNWKMAVLGVALATSGSRGYRLLFFYPNGQGGSGVVELELGRLLLLHGRIAHCSPVASHRARS